MIFGSAKPLSIGLLFSPGGTPFPAEVFARGDLGVRVAEDDDAGGV